jgi:cyclopropane fatty-acyl-phospholipid synthase-like methyltransferase
MVKYDPESRRKRADRYVADLASLTDLRHKRVLEIGPHLGDLSIRLAADFGCEVVGIDPRAC